MSWGTHDQFGFVFRACIPPPLLHKTYIKGENVLIIMPLFDSKNLEKEEGNLVNAWPQCAAPAIIMLFLKWASCMHAYARYPARYILAAAHGSDRMGPCGKDFLDSVEQTCLLWNLDWMSIAQEKTQTGLVASLLL